MTTPIHAAEGADRRAARLLLPHLHAGDTITRRLLNEAMVEAFGGSDAEGRWTQRASFEVLEHAVALHLRAAGPSLSSFADVAALIDLSSRLPTQTVRSEEQIEWQQFSTPVDIAAVAVLLANIQPDDVILEPSAGNGLLVAQIAAHRALHLNELDRSRRARLPDVFPSAAVTGHDGATINSVLSASDRPTLILMNPPFSRSLGRGADDYAAVRHLQAAIRRLQAGGRLVAIMPDWFGPSARMRDQYETILRDVTVRTAIRLENCYLKHGTSIAVRMLVIDKTLGKAPPATIQRSSIADLLGALSVSERSAARAEPTVTRPNRSGGISLFRAVKSSRPAPRAYHAPVDLKLGNRSIRFDPQKLSPTEKRDRLQLSEKKDLHLREGDRIRWTANDKERGLHNSALARVLAVDAEGVTVETAGKERLTLDLGDPMLSRLDLAYSLNMHMAQGITTDKAITVMSSQERNLSNQRLFNVGVTRVRDELTMVVDDKEKLERQLDNNPGNKTSALETVGRLDVDHERTRGKSSGPREKLHVGPVDLADLPPLPGELPSPAHTQGAAAAAGASKSPPDLKPDRGDALPPLPERSLGLDL